MLCLVDLALYSVHFIGLKNFVLGFVNFVLWFVDWILRFIELNGFHTMFLIFYKFHAMCSAFL